MTRTFIALEGAKGVGKTSVCGLLARHARSRNVVVTKEPTARFDLASEELLRGIDLASAIAADRRKHVAEIIEPALRSGLAVICDRYILSSLVFHTADGVSPEVVRELNDGFPMPTVNIILSAPADVLMARRQSRPATRLQTAWSPEAEMARYRDFGNDMQRRHDVGVVEARCATPDDKWNVVQLIMRLISEDVSA